MSTDSNDSRDDSFYTTLGVPEQATPAEIEAAYLRLIGELTAMDTSFAPPHVRIAQQEKLAAAHTAHAALQERLRRQEPTRLDTSREAPPFPLHEVATVATEAATRALYPERAHTWAQLLQFALQTTRYRPDRSTRPHAADYETVAFEAGLVLDTAPPEQLPVAEREAATAYYEEVLRSLTSSWQLKPTASSTVDDTAPWTSGRRVTTVLRSALEANLPAYERAHIDDRGWRGWVRVLMAGFPAAQAGGELNLAARTLVCSVELLPDTLADTTLRLQVAAAAEEAYVQLPDRTPETDQRMERAMREVLLGLDQTTAAQMTPTQRLEAVAATRLQATSVPMASGLAMEGPWSGYASERSPASWGKTAIVPWANRNYASWWSRAAALVVDVICVQGATFLLGFIVALPLALGGTNVASSNSTISSLGTLISLTLTLFLCWLQGTYGITPGKKLLGLELISNDTGQYIGFGYAVLRRFARIADFLTLGIGFLLPLFNTKRQTLADMAVHSIVVRTR